MALKEKVYKVLIVSSSQNFNSAMKEFLKKYRCYEASYVNSVSAAKKEFLEHGGDFVIVNCPLPDEFGTKFAIDVIQDKSCVSLLLTRSEVFEETYEETSNYGVYVLPKPLNAQTMVRAFEWMCTTIERLKKLKKKSISIHEKMEEIRMVNRAKWALINHVGMTEDDAHRYIEKQAMDSCQPKMEIAKNIIKTYK